MTWRRSGARKPEDLSLSVNGLLWTSDCWHAVDRLQGGESLAQSPDSLPDRFVEDLAGRYGGDLLRFIARRMRIPADARDVAQESYVRLLRLERKDLIRDPRTYLYRVAANVMYEFELRRRADTQGMADLFDEQAGIDGGGFREGDLNTLALRSQLEKTLGELSQKCRAVLILHRREGMTYDEISRQIGISTSMVKKYLAQGLLHCRERLKDFR
jgi:RNA polymerase sigma-19 factor, ECF subfamily